MSRKKKFSWGWAAFAVLLVLAAAAAVFLFFFGGRELLYTSYLQSEREIHVMESGILQRNLSLFDGVEEPMVYVYGTDVQNALRERYGLSATAGEGTSLQRALRLMHEYSPRLTHKSDYDNHIGDDALAVLAYALDRSDHGINCRAYVLIPESMRALVKADDLVILSRAAVEAAPIA